MNKVLLSWILTLITCINISIAQQNDPVLFTIQNEEVRASEFVYIYSKTNGKEADFSEESLKEYLDLYVKFKLKVQRAKELQLDTIPSLQKELEGYRQKLADSYLIDKEVTEKLTREVYDRAQQDVEISYVLFNVAPGASPEDTLAVYNKALGVRKMIEEGDFADVAKQFSEDKSVQRNGGYIGYVTVPFPNGFYNLEKAAYTLPLNSLSKPVRTKIGYYILKVHNRRPARGEMEVAHILVRTKEGEDNSRAKPLIDSLYDALNSGANFEDLSKKYSEDLRTASKGGYLGFFGINKLQLPFEEAAFKIEGDGQYSPPTQTTIGWHIIKRVSKKTIQPYPIEKSRLQQLVKKDARHEDARVAMLERIKKEGNLREYNNIVQAFTDTVSSNFLTFKWRAPKNKSEAVVMRLGEDYEVTLGAFTDFLGNASRKRIRMGRNTAIPKAVQMLFDEFVEANLMKYEESQLEKKYPEFKYLMGEYEQGILLFEISKMEAWDKASQDTSGLKAHYEKVKNKFKWDERAVTTQYTILASSKDKLEDIRTYAQTHSREEVLQQFNREENTIVTARAETVEKKKDKLFFRMPWKKGEISKTNIDGRTKNFQFTKIEDILPPALKTLNEARGFIVADYQDYLEKEWVSSLRKRYDVEINEATLKGLIK